MAGKMTRMMVVVMALALAVGALGVTGEIGSGGATAEVGAAIGGTADGGTANDGDG